MRITRRFVLALVFVLAEVVDAAAQCDYTSAGCDMYDPGNGDRFSGRPTATGYCRSGRLTCWSCTYNCTSGATLQCAETDNGSVCVLMV